MKKTAFLLLSASIIGLAGLPEPVWAQSQLKRKPAKKIGTTGKNPAPEAYSATEDSFQASVNLATQSAPLKAAPTKAANKYDVVAEDHRDSIVGRLELIQSLIVRHGRAYDYRTTTTAQLEKTLKELDDRLSEKAEMSLAPDSLSASLE